MRNFLTKNYPSLKTQLNYKLPILIRESYGIPPTLTARFERGEEVKTSLEGLDEAGVEKALNELLKDRKLNHILFFIILYIRIKPTKHNTQLFNIYL